MIAIGLMSGTSLDGIDAALVRIRPSGARYKIDLFNFQTIAFEPDVLERLRAVLPPASGSVERVARLHRDLGVAFAGAAAAVESDMPVDYVACHGQTVYHDGNAGVTLQIGDPFVIRERAEATVCYDFRSADCAAGGHGAPLVPFADALLLGSDEEDRVAVNVGGIANISILPRGCAPEDVAAWDTGPGNMLIDAFVRARTDGAIQYDENGALAMRGSVNEPALAEFLRDPFFAAEPPKTTGRERFGEQFLRDHGHVLAPLSLEDGCATLAALTSQSIGDAIHGRAPRGARVLVSGGGSRNAAIVSGLQKRLEGFLVERSDAMRINPDAKEAIAFALLGYETLRGRPANAPRATGAARPVPLGSIAPYDLPALLAKVEAECRASS